MLCLPIALSYPQKASDATKVAAVGRVALSRQAATGAQTANRLIDDMVTQVDTADGPGARTAAASVPRRRSSARSRPTTRRSRRGSRRGPRSSLERSSSSRRQVASVRDAATLNGLDFTPLPWYMVGPGIALLLTAGIALTATRVPAGARSASPAPVRTGVRAS